MTLHQGAAWIQLARRNSPAPPLSFIPLVLPSRSPRMEAILLGLAQARGQPSSWPAPFRAPPNPPQAFLNVHGGRWVPEKDCPATSLAGGQDKARPLAIPRGPALRHCWVRWQLGPASCCNRLRLCLEHKTSHVGSGSSSGCSASNAALCQCTKEHSRGRGQVPGPLKPAPRPGRSPWFQSGLAPVN